MGPSTVRTTHCMTEQKAEEILRTCPGEHPGLSLLLEAAERRVRHREKNGAIAIKMPGPSIKVKRRSAVSAPGGNAGAAGVDGEVVGESERADKENIRGDVGGSRSTTENSGGGVGKKSDEISTHAVDGTSAAMAVREFEAARAEVTAHRIDVENPVQDLVSEMMILAGELVGKFGAEHGIALPFRGQQPPRLPSDDVLAAGGSRRAFVHSFVHSFHSLIRSLTRSRTRAFVDSFTR